MIERGTGNQSELLAIADAPVVFSPRHFRGVGMQGSAR